MPMEVLIKNVEHVGSDCRVTFEAACGAGRAVWHGPAPVAGDRRFVELEVRASVVLGEDFVETIEPAGVSMAERGALLVGEVTAVENVDYFHMDLGCGGVDFEVTGPLPVVGRRYRLTAPSLELYDCVL
jgi:hypothetical protein